MTIGDRIKKRRKELDISVDLLAEILKKNRATIYRYESDEIENLPITVLEPLADALKTTPAYLMGWDDERENRLKSIRAERGLSKKELAELINVTESDIDKLDDGDITVLKTKEKIMELAKALNAHPLLILGVDAPFEMINDDDIDTFIDNALYGSTKTEENALSIYFEQDEYTEEEKKEIIKFAEFLKSKR